MKQYKTVNNLVGWITFLIAATVYCMTIEPTASFWDCPEFITTGYKLEVGHPPGAPFFMLVAGGNELRAVPKTCGRLDSHAINRCCNYKCNPTNQVVYGFVLFHSDEIRFLL